jgi:curved DNA-binding protein CbpA
MTNYYETLRIPETAAFKDVKTSYRKLALEFHPDRNSGDGAAEERFKNVQETYDVLSDPRKRRTFDEALEKRRNRNLAEYLSTTQPLRVARQQGIGVRVGFYDNGMFRG